MHLSSMIKLDSPSERMNLSEYKKAKRSIHSKLFNSYVEHVICTNFKWISCIEHFLVIILTPFYWKMIFNQISYMVLLARCTLTRFWWICISFLISMVELVIRSVTESKLIQWRSRIHIGYLQAKNVKGFLILRASNVFNDGVRLKRTLFGTGTDYGVA